MLMLSLLYLFYYYYLLNLLFFTNIYFWHIGQLWQRLANNGNRFLPTMATDKIPLMSVKKLQKARMKCAFLLEIVPELILSSTGKIMLNIYLPKHRNSV